MKGWRRLRRWMILARHQRLADAYYMAAHEAISEMRDGPVDPEQDWPIFLTMANARSVSGIAGVLNRACMDAGARMRYAEWKSTAEQEVADDVPRGTSAERKP